MVRCLCSMEGAPTRVLHEDAGLEPREDEPTTGDLRSMGGSGSVYSLYLSWVLLYIKRIHT